MDELFLNGNKIVLITKEILRADYLPVYGNSYWQTPNIDELAAKGTVFKEHFTSAPSTAMAVISMFSGLEPYELELKVYSEVDRFCQVPTLFDVLQKSGFSCNIVWSTAEYKLTYKYTKCFGNETTKIFNINTTSIKDTLSVIDNINEEKIFIWIHLPYTLEGRPSYGSDIDLFDYFIGDIRKRFDDNCIYISADHGNMSLNKGKVGYGFHVYNDNIVIPLITPRIQNFKDVEFPTSIKQLKDIILYQNIQKQPFIYSDTKYYLQAGRILCIIKANYKYIYNKIDKSEELYDFKWDQKENVNLIKFINDERIYETSRRKIYPYRRMYFYPYLKEAEEAYLLLKNEKDRIWKEGPYLIEKLKLFKELFRIKRALIKKYFFEKKK
ncbi:hypothetical protein ES708_13515 [subsurface metagenome]